MGSLSWFSEAFAPHSRQKKRPAEEHDEDVHPIPHPFLREDEAPPIRQDPQSQLYGEDDGVRVLENLASFSGPPPFGGPQRAPCHLRRYQA